MICLINMVVDLLGKTKIILVIGILIFLVSGCYRAPPGGHNIYNYYNVTNATGNGTVAGSDTEIQYNDNNSFGASSDLYWNDTEKLLGVQGYGMFSGTFNKSELYGTGNVRLGTHRDRWGSITLETNLLGLGGNDTVWAIDNGGAGIRIYETTPTADQYARFRITNETIIAGENVGGREIDWDITGDTIARDRVSIPNLVKCSDLITLCDNNDAVQIRMPSGQLCCG